ncbi:MAG: hypothetical protein CSA81_00445 [Acidobacteria bacterium]|nr:MAG: hypothetical protein CSA81_00445 [Acidobacteriota bacterium]
MKDRQSVSKIKNFLRQAWSAETCYPKQASDWSTDNPSLGQCAVSALVVQDQLGGELAKCYVGENSHYFNVIDGQIIDTTAEQFWPEEVDYADFVIKKRQDLLADESTRVRYEKLRQRFDQSLEGMKQIERDIAQVDFGDMGEACLDEIMVWFGEDNGLIVVGEAPARNGWIKSGVAWYSPEGKLLPSGVVMEKLLKTLDKDLLSVTFLEAIKCFPSDRRHLKRLAELYRPTLIEQLRALQPKIVLTMGDIPTRALVDEPYAKLSDVVGRQFEIDDLMVIPIFHPSPISPKSYKGNLPVFESIKKILDD